MMLIFHSLPWYLTGIILTIVCICFSLLGLLLSRKVFKPIDLKDYHNISGVIFNIIGVLYAVLLGFTILNVQDRYTTVHKNIEHEANTIADLFRDSAVFAYSDTDNIRVILRQYVKSVINEEWKSLAQGEPNSHTAQILQNLWSTYYKIKPQTDQQKIWYETSIYKLNDLNNFRFLRIFNSKESLQPMMWTLLLLGACILIFFIYFFWMDLKLQVLMTILLAGNISFMLFLIFDLDNPFLGGNTLYPYALERVSLSFDHWETVDDADNQ